MKRAALAFLILAAACAEPAPAADDPPLELALDGTRWVMVLDSAPGDARAPTLDFAEQSRAGGFAGCNRWFAQINRANGGLRFGVVGMTRRACPDPAMSIERDFAAKLERTRSAQLDGEDLLLFGDEADQVARFTPAN